MAWDNTWEEVFSNNEWGKYPAESLIRFIARNFYKVNKRESIKILEVGCGPGANLWYMNREGFTVYGIDGSETAIKKAEKRLKEDIWDGKGNYSLQVGDIISLPFEDNFFDAVIDCEVTYANKYDEAKRMFAEMHRVVRGGAYCTRGCSLKALMG